MPMVSSWIWQRWIVSSARVLGVLDGADLNQVVPEMGSGHLQPSTEALARWAWERLAEQIPEPAHLIRV